MELLLPRDDHLPLYLTLYQHIRGLIQDGALQDGTKLPSIRSLREQTKLSKTTIETAYHMLLEEGFVYSKPRAGLFVIHPQAAPGAKTKPAKPSNIEHIPAHRHADPLPLHNEKVIDFSLLAVDGDSFPLRPWKSVLHDALSLHISSVHQYGDPQGEYGLRLQLAHYLKRARGVNCLPEQIVIGSSFTYSTQILAKLLGGGGKIAVEAAGIAQVGAIFAQNGFDAVPVPFHNQELLAAELPKKDIQALYVTPSHRPSASPLPYATRQLLLNWAVTNSAFIIEDDYDGEFRYSGKTIPSLQSLDDHGSVIYIGTYSKAFTPALRLNYMVVPLQLTAKLQSIHYALSSPSRIDQWAMQLFMERGHWFAAYGDAPRIYLGFGGLTDREMDQGIRLLAKAWSTV
ncbi:PLP-dependent aminotransferase family protein [Paenibacillus sp. LHD-38]|uniref:MocR-like pyridoxine biosynthesis transcription factor PdxR n=1 Tax=Paenibacillus sp. LHD-38 TaxID=3072143 RepID=UPI00280FC0A2|nr:PLP-dependent aminotransferase family protein [Paenibacillus sp. LHD-38]MDQ8738040.1 PLP-dependent aminotransferase family protein [Paenibacillus sp. LHD-38]